MATLYPILESVMEPIPIDASSNQVVVESSNQVVVESSNQVVVTSSNQVVVESSKQFVDTSSNHFDNTSMNQLYNTSSYHFDNTSMNHFDNTSSNHFDNTSSNQFVIKLNIPPPPPLKLKSNPTLTDIFNVITTNPVFSTEIETFITSLQLTGGKLTTANIPILLLLLTDLIDNTGNFNLSTASLPVLIKMLYEYLVNRYDLIPLTERVVCEEMFLCSMNLLLRVPLKKIKNRLVKLFSCCN
jgi:hypothetical protein